MLTELRHNVVIQHWSEQLLHFVYIKIKLLMVEVKYVLFSGGLVKDQLSVHMLKNYIAAIRAKFVLYGLNDTALYHHKIKSFKS